MLIFSLVCQNGFLPSTRAIYQTSIFLAFAASAFAQVVPPPDKPNPERFTDMQITSYIYKPHQLPPPPLSQLQVPAGFKIEKFAENLGNARMLATGPNGDLYVTRREQGDVVKLKIGANGLSAGEPVRVAARPGVHGIAFHRGKVYLATPHEIFTGEVKPDGSFGPLEMVIHDLPDAGQHNTRTVQIGPDEMMYIGVGSTTNEANEPNQEAATLLRASLDGKHRSVFASGLRDTIGWGWHPVTGELWGMDQGIDWMGNDVMPEELNRIEKGKHYGWPYVYADNKINPRLDPPPGIEKTEWAKNSTPMVMGYIGHSSPIQLAFYQASQFPADYKGDAFVSMHGSWNRKPASGYEVIRIHFENGQPQKIEPFVTGFLTEEGEYGRPAGALVTRDGSFLFTDDRNGIIYRVSYQAGGASGAASNQEPTAVPAKPMLEQNQQGVKKPLAYEMPEFKNKNKIEVTSPAYKAKGTIPVVYSHYDQNASIPLAWAGGPAGTKSYALLMEDPDATSTPLPVVHWVAWNIPTSTSSLREGLLPTDFLQDPKGLRQGTNSMGVVGYSGPKPPEGDPAHRYFIQIFALDRELDLPRGAKRDELIAASAGHVLAVGVLEGKFKRPSEPKKP